MLYKGRKVSTSIILKHFGTLTAVAVTITAFVFIITFYRMTDRSRTVLKKKVDAYVSNEQRKLMRMLVK